MPTALGYGEGDLEDEGHVRKQNFVFMDSFP